MIRKKLFIFIIIISTILIFTSCNNDRGQISGSYFTDKEEIYVFYDTGKVEKNDKKYEYKNVGEDLYIIYFKDEVLMKLSKDKKKMTINFKDGEQVLLQNPKEHKNKSKLKVENKKIENDIKGKYKAKINEAEIMLTISDDKLSIEVTELSSSSKKTYDLKFIKEGNFDVSYKGDLVDSYLYKKDGDKLIIKNKQGEMTYEKVSENWYIKIRTFIKYVA